MSFFLSQLEKTLNTESVEGMQTSGLLRHLCRPSGDGKWCRDGWCQIVEGLECQAEVFRFLFFLEKRKNIEEGRLICVRQAWDGKSEVKG